MKSLPLILVLVAASAVLTFVARGRVPRLLHLDW